MKVLLVVLGLASVVALALLLLRPRRSRQRADPKVAPDDDPTRRVAALVDPLRKPTVLLRPADHASTSYLGGQPPAFPGFTWPTVEGRPLGFLACLDLSQIHTFDWLPDAGLLLFFYDIQEQPWGFDPKQADGWRVVHVPDPSHVTGTSPFPAGLASEWQLPRRDLRFEVASMPPPWELTPLAGEQFTDGEFDEVHNALERLRLTHYGDGPMHQVGGYPEPIQDAEMPLECQLASRGIYVGDPSGYEDPRVEALRAGAEDWRLLLQVDSDDDLGVMWGDAGIVYFWIREQDARRGDFGKAWLILQCH